MWSHWIFQARILCESYCALLTGESRQLWLKSGSSWEPWSRCALSEAVQDNILSSTHLVAWILHTGSSSPLCCSGQGPRMKAASHWTGVGGCQRQHPPGIPAGDVSCGDPPLIQSLGCCFLSEDVEASLTGTGILVVPINNWPRDFQRGLQYFWVSFGSQHV